MPDAGGGNAGLIVRVDKPGVGADNFDGYEISLDARESIGPAGLARPQLEADSRRPLSRCRSGSWISLIGPIVGRCARSLRRRQKSSFGTSIAAPCRAATAWDCGPGKARFVTATCRCDSRRTGERLATSLRFPSRTSRRSGRSERHVAAGAARLGRGHAQAVETDRPFVGNQCQQVTFAGGTRRDRRGQSRPERLGIGLRGRQAVRGICLGSQRQTGSRPANTARRRSPPKFGYRSKAAMASKPWPRPGSAPPTADWSRLDFSLTPAGHGAAGDLSSNSSSPAAWRSGHAFLQPGSWGRFKNLPVRRDVAEALVDQGITVLRYGGSMVNHPEYRWKKMIGPRDRRPPYHGLWYPYSSNGWGIVDFIDFCEAAGFRCIPAFNMDETPQDMADFVEYVNGPADSPWGRQRVAAGHPEPYRLRFLELGNEERVDDKYFAKFKAAGRSHLGQRSRDDTRRRRLRLQPEDYRSDEFRRGRFQDHHSGRSGRNSKTRQSS